MNRSLAIFPECNWQPLAEAISRLELYTQEGLAVRRQMFANAREVSLDKEGRVIIPQDMVEYAQLDGKVIVSGDWDKVTVWNHANFLEQTAEDDLALSEKFPSLLSVAKGVKAGKRSRRRWPRAAPPNRNPMDPRNVYHVPVMESEVTELLRPSKPGSVFVDCTIGYGGHSAAMARFFDSRDWLIGIDRDEEALAYCRERFKDAPFRMSFHHRGFEELEEILAEEGIDFADRFLIDCGFSSPQVDRAERGFSFSRDAELDMRMDRRQPLTAKDVIQTWDEKELAGLFQRYGEERFSRRIAKAIVRRRKEEPIGTTQCWRMW